MKKKELESCKRIHCSTEEETKNLIFFLFLLRFSLRSKMADDYGYPSYGRGGGGKSYEPFR